MSQAARLDGPGRDGEDDAALPAGGQEVLRGVRATIPLDNPMPERYHRAKGKWLEPHSPRPAPAKLCLLCPEWPTRPGS